MKIVCAPCNDTFGDVCENATVPEENRNYLRQWREKKGLTQEELADRIGTTKAVISLLENEKRPLSSTWLRKLAVALDTTPGRILDIDPGSSSAEYLDFWDHKLGKEDRDRAIRVLRSLTGTDD